MYDTVSTSFSFGSMFDQLAAAGITPAVAIFAVLALTAVGLVLWSRAAASARGADEAPSKASVATRRDVLGAPAPEAAAWRRAA